MNLLENKPESTVVGTIGIGPLRGMEASGICELRKFYLLSEIRGLGLRAVYYKPV